MNRAVVEAATVLIFEAVLAAGSAVEAAAQLVIGNLAFVAYFGSVAVVFALATERGWTRLAAVRRGWR